MAQVIVRARAACEDARRLRPEAVGLRFAARRKSADAQASLRAARSACARAQAARHARLPSAWSMLEWRASHEAPDRALRAV